MKLKIGDILEISFIFKMQSISDDQLIVTTTNFTNNLSNSTYRLRWHRFRKIKSLEVVFPPSGIVLLDGRSGIGKTNILDAISFVLYEDIGNTYYPRKERASKGKHDPTWVELTFPNGLIIYRQRRPNLLRVTVNSVELIDDSAQAYIDRIFGSSNIWSAGGYLKQLEMCSFFSMTSDDKLALLQQISFMGNVDPEKFDQLLNKTNEKITLLSHQVQELENHCKVLYQLYLRLYNQTSEDVRSRKVWSREKLLKYLTKYKVPENELMFQQLLSGFRSHTQNRVQGLQTQISEDQVKIAQIKENLRQRRQIQNFLTDNEHKLKEFPSNLSNMINEYEVQLKELSNFQNKISTLQSSISENKIKLSQIKENLRQRESILSNLKDNEDQLKHLPSNISDMIHECENQLTQLPSSFHYQNKIQKLQWSISENKVKLVQVKDHIRQRENLQSLLKEDEDKLREFPLNLSDIIVAYENQLKELTSKIQSLGIFISENQIKLVQAKENFRQCERIQNNLKDVESQLNDLPSNINNIIHQHEQQLKDIEEQIILARRSERRSQLLATKSETQRRLDLIPNEVSEYNLSDLDNYEKVLSGPIISQIEDELNNIVLAKEYQDKLKIHQERQPIINRINLLQKQVDLHHIQLDTYQMQLCSYPTASVRDELESINKTIWALDLQEKKLICPKCSTSLQLNNGKLDILEGCSVHITGSLNEWKAKLFKCQKQEELYQQRSRMEQLINSEMDKLQRTEQSLSIEKDKLDKLKLENFDPSIRPKLSNYSSYQLDERANQLNGMKIARESLPNINISMERQKHRNFQERLVLNNQISEISDELTKLNCGENHPAEVKSLENLRSDINGKLIECRNQENKQVRLLAAKEQLLRQLENYPEEKFDIKELYSATSECHKLEDLQLDITSKLNECRAQEDIRLYILGTREQLLQQLINYPEKDTTELEINIEKSQTELQSVLDESQKSEEYRIDINNKLAKCRVQEKEQNRLLTTKEQLVQQLTNYPEKDTVELEINIEKLQAELNSTLRESQRLENERSKVNDKLTECRFQENKQIRLLATKEQLLQQLTNYPEITTVENEDNIKRLEDKLRTITTKSQKLEEDINAQGQLSQLITLQNQYNQYQKVHQETNQKLASLQKIKGTLITAEYVILDNVLAELNNIVGEILDILFHEPISVTVRSLRQLKTDDRIKPQINCQIMYEGSECSKISELSGGEGMRVSLALAIAFSRFNNTPFLLLDESLSSLDVVTKESAIKVIRKYLPNKLVIAVNHDTTVGVYDSVIQLSK